MTLYARRVLDDCKAALKMLEDEEDEQQWRILWAGAMTLVRAVGHVLKNVDGENDSEVRSLAEAAWNRWSTDRASNEIFWEFIQKERNNILKEYRFNVHDSASVGLVAVEMDEAGNEVAVESPFMLDENLYRPIEEGFQVGEDARDVYVNAIEWWDMELSRIEADLIVK
ncbi:MAG: hypothetical protein F4X09_12955 [Gammaproteobacteria bacterium]|nr:hypothetical protein [Gammaproteobacteria bacterium]